MSKPTSNGHDTRKDLFKPLKTLAADAQKRLEAKVKRAIGHGKLTPKDITGVPTGFPDLDALTGGLPYGISVVGGRPEDGLVDFGLNIALNASKTHKVAYFNPNLPLETLIDRVVCCQGHISMRNLREGFATERDLGSITGAIGKLTNNQNLVLYDNKISGALDFAHRCEQTQDTNETQLIILDRFQNLLPESANSAEGGCSLYWKAKEIRGTLGDLVSSKGLALLLISEVKKIKAGERITPSHLRDWGMFEYDAHPIILLERPIGYGQDDSAEEVEGYAITGRIYNNFEGSITDQFLMTYLRGYGRFESAAKVSDEDVPRE